MLGLALAVTMHALGHAALALAAGACAAAIAGAPGLVGGGSGGSGLAGSEASRALSLATAGLLAVIVKVVGGVWAAHAQARICADVGTTLRAEALDGWLALHRLRPSRQLDQGAARSGTSAPSRGVAALTSHVRELELGLHAGLLGGARAIAQLIPLVAVLVWLAPRLALVALCVFAPFSAMLSIARKKWKRANARAASENERLLAAADEAVRHADLWTTYGAERTIRAHVASIGRAIATRAAKLEASAAALSGANEVLGAIALVLALAAARAGFLGGAAEAGRLLPFAVAFFLAYRPLRDLTEARLAWGRAQAAHEALGELLDAGAREEHVQDDEAPARTWPLASLEIDGVGLANGDSLSLDVRGGSIVAIVGPTGSGKTTLIRALLGLERTREGTLRYGGETLDLAPPGPRARPFAWVPQEAPLLADTLEANVSLGAHARDVDTHASLEALGAGHLASALGDARLGAGERAVSGGERQWIALASAVATRQPVLLLDEPTSGLDPASQERVLEAIARLRGERTVILVTHRAEPLAIADHVVRLEGAPRSSPRARVAS